MPDQPISTYQKLIEQYSLEEKKIKNKHRLLGTVRLIIAIAFLTFLYFYFTDKNTIYLLLMIVFFLLFFYLIKVHQKMGRKKDFLNTLVTINTEELNYLKSSLLPFENGEEFISNSHAYTSDLDVYGPKSLFQNLNRTATYIGKVKLSQLFSKQLPEKSIQENQSAVAELSEKLNWRQHFLAHAKISNDSKSIYEQIISWVNFDKTRISKLIKIISNVLPALMICLIALYYFTDSKPIGNSIIILFIINLTIVNRFQKSSKEEVVNIHKIDEIIKDYSSMLTNIQSESFKSPHLIQLQETLNNEAGIQLQKLSGLFKRVENIQNLIGGIILNGLFLYHVHTIQKIVKWKGENKQKFINWLSVLGELEALNSLANFKFNNPHFIFPKLNHQLTISFKDLGHPLILEPKRVCNSISFQDHRFVILTGSNMSGKSTFLRTLGVNMVLAGMGSVICAESADIHPMPVLVSMGQADSLSDNESYFFAEVKRLKYIMDHLSEENCFILLDEILRGTNSDDKRNGTIGVIEKIIQTKAIGMLATHDLEVCLTTDQHPDILTNKRFEVEIINNELSFDYKLRPGVCENKSATFLMKKMEIIS